MRVSNGDSLRLSTAAIVIALALAGCSRHPAGASGAGMPAPEVSVVTVAPHALPVSVELPGRVDAVRTAQVRARVTGVLLKEVTPGGSDVKAGQVLFRIDPAPLQAALDAARASLDKALAQQVEARAKDARYQALAAINAVSRQDALDAHATAEQANAEVAAARAAVETARLNLGYATVTAPIAGRLGTPQVTEGALVSQSAATLLATVQQLDPIYLDLTESSNDLLRLKRQLASGQLKQIAPGAARVTLVLDDGSLYPHPGRLLFSDATVDPGTGMITLRAEFPNPEHLLLPGMYARARLEQGVDNAALTVPQQSLSRGADGTATVMVVDAGNKVEPRPVTAGAAIGNQWIITAGLKAGDRVVVEGLQKIHPGATVKPVPYVSATPAAAGQGH